MKTPIEALNNYEHCEKPLKLRYSLNLKGAINTNANPNSETLNSLQYKFIRVNQSLSRL